MITLTQIWIIFFLSNSIIWAQDNEKILYFPCFITPESFRIIFDVNFSLSFPMCNHTHGQFFLNRTVLRNISDVTKCVQKIQISRTQTEKFAQLGCYRLMSIIILGYLWKMKKSTICSEFSETKKIIQMRFNVSINNTSVNLCLIWLH